MENWKYKALDILWKFPRLFKMFVLFDYIIRIKRYPRSIRLTRVRHAVVVNNRLLGFYAKSYLHYEILSN